MADNSISNIVGEVKMNLDIHENIGFNTFRTKSVKSSKENLRKSTTSFYANADRKRVVLNPQKQTLDYSESNEYSSINNINVFSKLKQNRKRSALSRHGAKNNHKTLIDERSKFIQFDNFL